MSFEEFIGQFNTDVIDSVTRPRGDQSAFHPVVTGKQMAFLSLYRYWWVRSVLS